MGCFICEGAPTVCGHSGPAVLQTEIRRLKDHHRRDMEWLAALPCTCNKETDPRNCGACFAANVLTSDRV